MNAESVNGSRTVPNKEDEPVKAASGTPSRAWTKRGLGKAGSGGTATTGVVGVESEASVGAVPRLRPGL